MSYDLTKKIAFSCLLVTLLAGCDSKPKDTAAATPAGEVAAKVNGTDLPAAQVELVLQRISKSGGELSEAASLQTARNLVDHEVIAQKAIADKLDQDPAILQALAIARRQVLAEAYMSRKLGTTVEPSEVEVSGYYDQHPELFAKRKIYRLQELSIQAAPDKHETIRAQLTAAKTLNDFAKWLKSENLTTKAGQGVKPAEQIPLDILPKLAAMPDGQAIIVNAPDGLLVIVLADSQLQPVTLEQAKPAIVRMLQTQARQKAAKTELDALKANAKIEYVGKFSDAGKLDAAPAAKETPAPTPAAGADAAEAAPASSATDAPVKSKDETPAKK